MSRQITPSTTLDNLRREAKRWLKALRANTADARDRLQRALPEAPAVPTLRDVQHALAREHGLQGWGALKDRLTAGAALRRYEKIADALVAAYRTGEERATRIVWDYFGHMRAWDAMRRYVRLDLGKTEQPIAGEDDVITVAEAQFLVARAQGFENWTALADFANSVSAGRTITAKFVEMRGAPESDAAQPALRSRDWDEVLAVMRARRLPALHAAGQMTDDVLAGLSQLDHITTLDLQSSRALTDEGLKHIARLPQLQHLNLAGCAITDRGLAVLRRLPALETVVLAGTRITDAGAVHLAACDRLRTVDLSGTSSGDGALRALAGKRALCDFRSGEGLTDAGLALLQDLPVFKTWHGGEESMALLSPEARPNSLTLRGPFTDRGMASLAGLDGLFALNVDSDRLAITGAGLAPLVTLPHLSWLAFDAKDDSMQHIAALPHLRFLLCQDTSAGDEGFTALSRSRSIEHIWGRRCYNLQRRGFIALADMPALRYLSVSCRNVDDAGLSALPRFPALRELMPMDVPDEGYRHVGRCDGLTSLVLMYCRETTDDASRHITGLPNLTKYFVSYNRITDLTPELLSGMSTLEEVTFDSCAGLTNTGVAALARLPRLRTLRVSGMPRVTGEVAAHFAPGVVSYAP